ncbi:MAG: hypothetical protein AAF208_14925 [Cyanobacteria bacterium P01_A01_bin.45]
MAEVWVRNDWTVELAQSKMVAAGLAYPYERYKSDCLSWEAVKSSQEYAQELKVGVWGGSYEKPWDYRRRGK